MGLIIIFFLLIRLYMHSSVSYYKISDIGSLCFFRLNGNHLVIYSREKMILDVYLEDFSLVDQISCIYFEWDYSSVIPDERGIRFYRLLKNHERDVYMLQGRKNW